MTMIGANSNCSRHTTAVSTTAADGLTGRVCPSVCPSDWDKRKTPFASPCSQATCEGRRKSKRRGQVCPGEFFWTLHNLVSGRHLARTQDIASSAVFRPYQTFLSPLIRHDPGSRKAVAKRSLDDQELEARAAADISHGTPHTPAVANTGWPNRNPVESRPCPPKNRS